MQARFGEYVWVRETGDDDIQRFAEFGGGELVWSERGWGGRIGGTYVEKLTAAEPGVLPSDEIRGGRIVLYEKRGWTGRRRSGVDDEEEGKEGDGRDHGSEWKVRVCPRTITLSTICRPRTARGSSF